MMAILIQIGQKRFSKMELPNVILLDFREIMTKVVFSFL